MIERVAIDTNVLIYCHSDNDINKKKVALDILEFATCDFFASCFGVYELPEKNFQTDKTGNNGYLHRKPCRLSLADSPLQTITLNTIKTAQYLIQRYDFQLFDAVVVASALEAGCTTIYSEDMQHKMKIDGKMTIINPFL